MNEKLNETQTIKKLDELEDKTFDNIIEVRIIEKNGTLKPHDITNMLKVKKLLNKANETIIKITKSTIKELEEETELKTK